MKNFCNVFFKLIFGIQYTFIWALQGPYIFHVYILPQDRTAPAPFIGHPKNYPLTTPCRSLNQLTIPQHDAKKLPNRALNHAYGFVIPAFEQYIQTSLVDWSLLPLQRESASFPFLEEYYCSSFMLQRPAERMQHLGNISLYAGPHQTLKLSFHLQINEFAVKFNETVRLKEWIVIDNPHHAALIRITPFDEL